MFLALQALGRMRSVLLWIAGRLACRPFLFVGMVPLSGHLGLVLVSLLWRMKVGPGSHAAFLKGIARMSCLFLDCGASCLCLSTSFLFNEVTLIPQWASVHTYSTRYGIIIRGFERRNREIPRCGCVFWPQTSAKPTQDRLTSDFEQCFRLCGGARAKNA